MQPRTRALAVMSLVALGGLLSVAAGEAKAQVVVTTPVVPAPRVVVPAGAAVIQTYPSYVPVAPVYGVYPARPYVYRPGFYGPRPFGPRPYYGPRPFGPRPYYGPRGW